MMSTAILLATGTEQTNVRPGSGDLLADQGGGPEGDSFAKSFNERVGDSVLIQGKNSADEAKTALRNLNTAALAKTTNEVADISAGVKEKAVAAQISEHDELKMAVAEKTVQPKAEAVAGSKEKVTLGGPETEEVESSALAGEPAGDVSTASRTPLATSVAGLTAEGLKPFVRNADGDRPLVSSTRGSLIQKETEIGGKTKDVATAKKNAGPQESVAPLKTEQNPIGTAVKTSAIETPAVAGSAESAAPVMEPAVPTGVVPRSEIGNVMEGSGRASSGAAKPLAGVPSAPADGSVRKEATPGAKNSAIDTETIMTGTEDPSVSPRPGTGPEKMAVVAIPGDGDDKTQNAPGFAAATIHSMTGGTGASSGSAPTAVMSGNTAGELTAAKLPVGDTGPHTAGSPSGPGEQDGMGVAAALTDGTPRMLTATPTALEVGIQNGTHGWLMVRAEMAEGGVVNASVSAASSAGQAMLHRELPALNAYLQEERVSVNTVVVHAPLAVAVESRSSAGMDSAGGQTPQRNNEGEEQQQNIRKPNLGGPDEAMTYRSLHGVDQDGSLPLVAYASGGGWLSVRA